MNKDDKNAFGGDFFDWGFTAANIDDLDVLKEKEQQIRSKEQQIQSVAAGASELEERMDKLYNAFLPLLTNLKKDADTKEYILWPDRKQKIESFERLLKNIYEGKA
jgi:hypothetical protein